MDPYAAISCAHVRSVLMHLKAGRAPAASPLSQLAAVRQSLRRCGYRPSAEACHFALGQLLTEVVEAEIARLRQRAVRHGASRGSVGGASGSSASRKIGGNASVGAARVYGAERDGAAGSGARASICADFAADDPDLEAWSGVYHVYLRPDLGIDLATLATWVDDRHRRTLQRRLARGVEALTARLRVIEHAALAPSRRARLGVRLPAPTASRLFGVDGLVERLAAGLIEGSGSPVIALAGCGGSGKTAVARAVAERCAASGAFDAIVWLDAVRGAGSHEAAQAAWADRIRRALAEALPAAGSLESAARVAERRMTGHGYGDVASLGSAGPSLVAAGDHWPGESGSAAVSPAPWRIVALGHPHAADFPISTGSTGGLVIIDGLDDPADAVAAVGAVRAIPAGTGTVQALVTGRVGWSACPGVRVARMGSLGPGTAMALLRHLATERGLDAVAEAGAEDLEPLIAATAGHPLAIQMAVAALRAADPADVAAAFAAGEGVAASLGRNLWSAAWLGAAPEVRAVVRSVAAGREDELDGPALCAAVDAGLIEPAGACVRPRRWRTLPFLERILAAEAEPDNSAPGIDKRGQFR